MISALSKQPDGTIELTITVPAKRVKEAYQKTLTALAKKAEIKGFRKGKAPKKIVQEKLGKTKVYEEVLKTLITQVYLEAVKEQKIKPIVNPKIKVISLKEGEDWQIKAITCELPRVKLGDYKGEIKKTLAAAKIWVPGKDGKEKKETVENQDQRIDKILQTLLKTAKVKIPSILIEEDVNRMLSRLIDQTGRLGLTVEQYLASAGKTQEQLRAEYQKQAENSLKTELILASIADEQNVTVKDEEVEKMIQATPDEKARKAMNNPAQKAYLKQLLRKRTVIDSLLKL